MFEKKEENKKRFSEKCSQGVGLGFVSILVDNETGVNYLAVGGSAPTYITPLLDADGKIIAERPSEQQE